MRNVPELRFDGFDGEWEEKKLEDSFNVTMGQSPNSKNYTVDSDSLPLIGGNADIKQGKINPSIFTTQVTKKSYPGNIIMTVRAPVGDLAMNSSEVVIGRGVCSIDGNNYLYYNLEKKKYENYWRRFISGSTFESINSSDIKNVPISIPENYEQEKIGDLFRKLDDLIEIQEDKVSKMEDFKKSMLQKMFPKKDELVPEFRFDGFDGEWKNVYVKDIGSFLGGTSIECYFNKKGDYKVISIGSYSNNSKYIDQGLRVDLNDKTKSKLLSRNDLAMVLNDKTTQGNIIGRTLLIDEDNKYIFNQRTQRITPNFDKYNSLFLYYLFNSDIFRNKIKKISQGNTQIYVNWPNVESILLKVPKKEEQAKIGQFFKNLDTQIENEEKLLDSYKMMKKSLLQKMFV